MKLLTLCFVAAFAMPTQSEAGLFGTSKKEAAKQFASSFKKHVKASPHKAKELLCRKGDATKGVVSLRSAKGVLGAVPGVAQMGAILCKSVDGFAESSFMEEYDKAFEGQDPEKYLRDNGKVIAKDAIANYVMPAICAAKDGLPAPLPTVMTPVCAMVG